MYKDFLLASTRGSVANFHEQRPLNCGMPRSAYLYFEHLLKITNHRCIARPERKSILYAVTLGRVFTTDAKPFQYRLTASRDLLQWAVGFFQLRRRRLFVQKSQHNVSIVSYRRSHASELCRRAFKASFHDTDTDILARKLPT